MEQRAMSAAVDAHPAQLDAHQVRRALAAFEGLPGLVSVMYLQEQGAKPTYAQYATTTAGLDEAARNVVQVDLMDEPLGIYVRGTTVREGVTARGTSDDTVAWIAFRADLDFGKAGGPVTWPDVMEAFKGARLPTPTYWQHSGNGFYPTWQLAEPVAHGPEAVQLAADIEAELRRAWSAAGYRAGVDSCRDAARVWRLAGSVHRKDRARQITSTIGNVSGEVSTLAELRARVPVRPAARGFDGNRSAPRRARKADFEKTYAESLRRVVERGLAEFRHTFFVAARNAHRMEAIGLRRRDEIAADLVGMVRVYWPNAEFDGDDLQHIRDALNNPLDRGDHAGALASPWELIADEPAAGAETTQQAPTADTGTFLLPRETWDRTPTLKHIYQASMAQLTCPDAVLHATLAILASLVHHGTRVHTGKRPSVLSYYFAPVAPSGGGKSEALSCARELLQSWSDDRFAIVGADGYVDGPVGSGEGLIEAFIDDVFEDIIDPETKQPALDNNGNVKTRKVRKQARHNALFHTDEGRQVLAIDSRKGATVLSVLCELWSGAVAGQTNADKDRSRKLPAGSYVVGMLLGFQAATIDPLFADEAGGAPQRFAFASATYPPHADDLDAEDEPWPGPLGLSVNPGPVQVHLGASEQKAVRRHVRLQSAGQVQGGPMDGHRMLLRCRVAALLAILHEDTVAVERLDVSSEMWDLAGLIVDQSCALRDHLAAQGQRRKAAEARSADERATRRSVQAARETAEDAEQRAASRLVRVAAVVGRKVMDAGSEGVTRTQLRDAVGRDRDLLDTALGEAMAREWIMRGDGVRARYRPGRGVGDIPR